MNQIYIAPGKAMNLPRKNQQEGSFARPEGKRKGISGFAAFIAVMLFSCIWATGAFAQFTYYSKPTATNFNDFSSWGSSSDGTGMSPTAFSDTDIYVVNNGANVALTGDVTVGYLTVAMNSTLTVGGSNSYTITVANANNYNSTLTMITGGKLVIDNGTVDVHGSVIVHSGASFTQTGGLLKIDGNNGGVVAGSVAASTPLFAIGGAGAPHNLGTITLTGGTIQIVDPHVAATAATGYAFYVNFPTGFNCEASPAHTVIFGNGSSADAGGHVSGFYVDPYVGSGRLNFGSVNVNAGTGTNRIVTTPFAIGAHGDVQVTTGEFRPSSMVLKGNLTVNGTYTATGALTFATPSGNTSAVNSTTLQTVTVATGGVVRNLATAPTANYTTLVFNNTTAGGVTFTGSSAITNQPANSISVSTTLTFTAGRVASAGGTAFILGTPAPGAGTLNVTAGGFLPGTTYGRWSTAAGTGSSFTAGADATSTTSRFPFINAAGLNRSAWIERVGAASAAGVLAMTYNEVAGQTAVSIADTTPDYTVTTRANDTWAVSALAGTPLAATSFKLQLQAPGIFGGSLLASNARIVQGGAFVGNHQGGSLTPGGQRVGLTGAQLTAAPFTLAINTADVAVYNIANGNFDNPAIWSKGAVPSCNDIVTIVGGTSVTVNSSGQSVKGLVIAPNATLGIGVGELTVGCSLNNNSLVNNGELSVQGGTLTVNGNINNAGATSRLFQSGGTIIIDGNNGVDAESVMSGTPLLNIATTNVVLLGGTLLFVDPHIATSNALGYTIHFTNATPSPASLAASPLHTTQFGDGVSTTAGGNTNGFYINNWSSAAYLSLGSVLVNGGTGTNRNVTSLFQVTANGNVTVSTGSALTVTALIVGGNLTVNGTFVNTTGVVAAVVASNTSGVLTYGPATTAQTITNNGSIGNLATLPTANLGLLTVNNTSATGVTLASPLTVSGTLTLTNGKVKTDAVNKLTLNSTAAGAVVGGSATAYVDGPLVRSIATGNAATNFIHFPVGKTTYAPIWVAPVTTSAATMSGEAFDSNTGSADASIVNLANDRRWEALLLTGAASAVNVRIGDANLDNANVPVMAPAANGVYSGVFGSVGTFAAGTPNTVTGTAIAGPLYTGYIGYADSNACTGTPAPGNTIASSESICAGSSVNLSVQNPTSGSGVTYQWQSSANGTDWADIALATAATYTTVPTAATYYRLNVTCITGPATTPSAAVLVDFANEITGTTPDSRCGTGPVTLEAVASAGANVVWYDAATNGNVVGSGATLEVASLAATKTYYAVAQTGTPGTATLGAGVLTTNTSGITPFNSNYEGSRIQYLVKASELQALGLTAGNLTSLAFDVSAIGGTFVQSGYTIKIAATSAEALSGYVAGTFTTVYGPTAQGQTTLGWNTLSFSQPFAWNGQSNIVIEICHDNDTTNTCASCFGANSTVRYTATTYNSVYGRYVDNAAACGIAAPGLTAAISPNRANMIFGGALACNSARVPVIATVSTAPALTLSASSATICEGESTATVTLTSSVPPPPSTQDLDYDTYVWTPSAGVTGSAEAGWVFNPAATTTYTLNATQTAGSECANSATFTVTVNAAPTAIAIAAIAPTVCVNTVTALTSTGGNYGGAATIGAGTTLTTATEQPTAFMNRWVSYTMQTVYTAAELNAAGLYAGNIASMAFNVNTLGDAATNANFTVRIGTTTASNFATGTTAFVPTTDFVTVYTPQTYTHTATGWQVIPFTTPYVWDGESNIIVSVTMGGANATNNTQTYYTETTDNTVLWAYNTNAAAVSKKRLNVKFASTDSATVTWSPSTNLYTDAAATTAYVSGANAKVVYVKPSATANTVYTATAETNIGCSVEATVAVNAVDCGIGWGNLQWPANGEITTCGSHDVYARVYKEGITEAPGAGVGIQAWIGVNTSNTDPSTWAESDWHLATFNVQDFNNDEFKYTITGLPAGTYYYASRFQYLTGSYLYGGFQGPWGGGNVSGVLTVNSVSAPTAAATQTFCSGATIANLTTTTGTGIKWYADATGGTALDSTTALVTGEDYFASQTVNSCESTSREAITVTITSVVVDPIADVIACDSYTLPALTTGNYFTAPGGTGTQLNAGNVITLTQDIYVYATAGTAPVCSDEEVFTVTINSITAQEMADVTVCASYTLPSLNTGNRYYTAAGGLGVELAAGTVITSNQTIYVWATSTGTPACTDGSDFTVTVNTLPVVDELADVTVCESYALPVLNVGNYFTATGGAGTQLNAGDLITTNQTIYVYASGGPLCFDESSFTVTVNAINVTAPADVNVCNSYTLPELTTGNYFTAPNGGGNQLNAGDVITADQTIYVYAVSTGSPLCSDEDSFDVNITTVAQPTGAVTQTITGGVAGDVTIEDIVVNETGVIWFATEAAALLGTPALAAGTELVTGNTYYGILTNGTCLSTPLAVEITVVLGSKDFDMGKFSYYPNPVRNVLNIAYTSDITSVAVYNMLGQQVIAKKVNATETALDMSALADGTYVLNVTAGNVIKTIKVVKKQ